MFQHEGTYLFGAVCFLAASVMTCLFCAKRKKIGCFNTKGDDDVESQKETIDPPRKMGTAHHVVEVQLSFVGKLTTAYGLPISVSSDEITEELNQLCLIKRDTLRRASIFDDPYLTGQARKNRRYTVH